MSLPHSVLTQTGTEFEIDTLTAEKPGSGARQQLVRACVEFSGGQLALSLAMPGYTDEAAA